MVDYLPQIWKSLEATERTLVDMIQVKDYDTSMFFMDESIPPKSPQDLSKSRSDRLEMELYYLEVNFYSIL